MSYPIKTNFACMPLHEVITIENIVTFKKSYITGFSRMLMPSKYDLKIRVKTDNEAYAKRAFRKKFNIPKQVKL